MRRNILWSTFIRLCKKNCIEMTMYVESKVVKPQRDLLPRWNIIVVTFGEITSSGSAIKSHKIKTWSELWLHNPTELIRKSPWEYISASSFGAALLGFATRDDLLLERSFEVAKPYIVALILLSITYSRGFKRTYYALVLPGHLYSWLNSNPNFKKGCRTRWEWSSVQGVRLLFRNVTSGAVARMFASLSSS